VSDELKIDFDRGGAGTQAGFESMTSSGGDNSTFTTTTTFSNTFLPGEYTTVTFSGNRRKDRGSLSGAFAGQTALLEDWWGAESSPGFFDIDLDLPEGIYDLTTFHHDVNGGGTAQLMITDATGLLGPFDITETSGSSPSTIGTFSATIVSDGVNLINLDFVNLSEQLGINGLTLTRQADVIPEPSTFLIWALGLPGLAWCGRRRRTK
jgi:hypothetical protein